MGLFARLKLLGRLASTEGETSSQELGDLVESGSTVDVAGMAALGSAGAMRGIEQMKELHAAGLIDDETFKLIETSWAQAAASGYGPSIDRANWSCCSTASRRRRRCSRCGIRATSRTRDRG
jgi:hypothetical protein